MRVRDAMTRQAESIAPHVPVADAARRMRELDCGALPMISEDRVVGMLTDRDVAIRCVAEGKDPQGEVVGNLLSPEVLYCHEDDDVTESAHLMSARRVRRLPVLDGECRPVGIVSLGDVSMEAGPLLAGEAPKAISRPLHP